MQNGDAYLHGVGGYDGTNPATAKTMQQIMNSVSPDLSIYYSKTETDTLLSDKQDKITWGNNISVENGVVNVVYEEATTSTSGLMSYEDKTKLNSL